MNVIQKNFVVSILIHVDIRHFFYIEQCMCAHAKYEFPHLQVVYNKQLIFDRRIDSIFKLFIFILFCIEGTFCTHCFALLLEILVRIATLSCFIYVLVFKFFVLLAPYVCFHIFS